MHKPAPRPTRNARDPRTVPRLALECPCTHGAVPCFGLSLHARGCAMPWSVPARTGLCSGRRCDAAQRYPTSFWTATSAPLSSSSSIASKWPFCAAKCRGVRLHGGRRDSARRFIRRARTERLARSRRGRRRWLWRQSVLGRSGDCRSTPHSAARCAHHTCKRRGERAGPTGYPAQPIPENETGGPEVDIVSFRERRTARVLREDSAY